MTDDRGDRGKGRGPDGAGPDEPGGDDLDLGGSGGRRPGWLSTYGQPLWRILILLALLVGIVALRKPCAEGVAGLIGNFGPPPRDSGTRLESRSGGSRLGPTTPPAPGAAPLRDAGGHDPAGDAAVRH